MINFPQRNWTDYGGEVRVDRTSVGEDQFSPSFDLHQNFRFWNHYSFVRGIVFCMPTELIKVVRR
jgi:hypothetical protein